MEDTTYYSSVKTREKKIAVEKSRGGIAGENCGRKLREEIAVGKRWRYRKKEFLEKDAVGYRQRKSQEEIAIRNRKKEVQEKKAGGNRREKTWEENARGNCRK